MPIRRFPSPGERTSTFVPRPTIDSTIAAVDKVDSRQQQPVPSSVKSKAHSRLASFSRQRLLRIVQPIEVRPQGETLPEVPVSPSDAGSQDRRSDASTRSNASSETALTDHSSTSIKAATDRPSRESVATWRERGQSEDSEYQDTEAYERILRRSPRMMHQTSSKLLKMTGDDQPYTRDFKDLFATLIVSLPLTPHRVRFSKYPHTFTTEEAITNLGSLKFSQSNRMPDPKAPDRIVTTTTTTTFSMAREMARATCARFLEARMIESVDGRTDFSSRSSVWQLTPKGMHLLSRFCQRNGIHQRHVNELLDSPRNVMNLVILERDPETDEIVHDADTINVLFRRFAGDTGPNIKSEHSSSDSDSLNDYATGLVGVRMERAKSSRKDQTAYYAFTGKAAFDWLMDCTTTVNKREGFTLANLFMTTGLVEPFGEERGAQNGAGHRFAASRHVKYAVTLKGMQVAGWVPTPATSSHGETATGAARPNGSSLPVRDSNTNRMTVIIRDPALRLLFREYLRETHCEENLSFYTEVKSFLDDYQRAKRGSSIPRPDVIRETLASAYSLYNAFLAPGSPCELNIDHNLRNALAARMTRAVGEDEQMIRSLDEVADLFDQAQSSVFKLMASDSVPKFFREPKYAAVLKERNLEHMISKFAATNVSG
ncbi:hypothetical protein CBER1_08278 [Cercospora berteroae]|uniref:RGS domain-containing protein n=1 Tax=Cercospora berteroae TaxID=357750 RepID=A0A2S6C7L4_9PEZI|nr:hypothetical protein CBER1_08278 [Cercospora berteroae]